MLDAVPQIALRLGVATVLGAIVALLFRAARTPRERSIGFSQTLVMLSPLIATVMMAVGDNIAAAFTLVGTLAIVRFRTVVRETRDTVFVIFSVAAGMASGVGNFPVAAVGTAVVGVVVLVLRALQPSGDEPITATLRLTLTPASADPTPCLDAVRAFAPRLELTRSTSDRASDQLELRIRLAALDPSRSAELTAALLTRPEVQRAQVNSE